MELVPRSRRELHQRLPARLLPAPGNPHREVEVVAEPHLLDLGAERPRQLADPLAQELRPSPVGVESDLAQGRAGQLDRLPEATRPRERALHRSALGRLRRMLGMVAPRALLDPDPQGTPPLDQEIDHSSQLLDRLLQRCQCPRARRRRGVRGGIARERRQLLLQVSHRGLVEQRALGGGDELEGQERVALGASHARRQIFEVIRPPAPGVVGDAGGLERVNRARTQLGRRFSGAPLLLERRPPPEELPVVVPVAQQLRRARAAELPGQRLEAGLVVGATPGEGVHALARLAQPVPGGLPLGAPPARGDEEERDPEDRGGKAAEEQDQRLAGPWAQRQRRRQARAREAERREDPARHPERPAGRLDLAQPRPAFDASPLEGREVGPTLDLEVEVAAQRLSLLGKQRAEPREQRLVAGGVLEAGAHLRFEVARRGGGGLALGALDRIGRSEAPHRLVEPRHGVTEFGLGRGRDPGHRGQRLGLRPESLHLAPPGGVLLEAVAHLGRARAAPLGLEPGEALACLLLALHDPRQLLEIRRHALEVVLQGVDLGIQQLALGLESLDRGLDPERGTELGAGIGLRGPLQRPQRLDRVGVTDSRVGGVLEPRLERRGAPRLLVARHHLLELALADERALLELRRVEPQAHLPDRELVLAEAIGFRHLATAVVPHLHRAALEVARHRELLPGGLELELDPVGAAPPGAPALERGEKSMGPLVAVEAVERGRDGGEEARLAALVLVEYQVEAVGREAVFAAQGPEAVGLEPQQLHAARPRRAGAIEPPHRCVTRQAPRSRA